jgi:hypothetical protein
MIYVDMVASQCAADFELTHKQRRRGTDLVEMIWSKSPEPSHGLAAILPESCSNSHIISTSH